MTPRLAATVIAAASFAISASAELPAGSPSGVVFRCYAPGAEAVYLAGSFNGWAANDRGRVTNPTFLMDRDEKPWSFVATVPLDPGMHAFRFVIDGDPRRWVAPPELEERDRDGNAILRVTGDGSVMVRRSKNPAWAPAVTPTGTVFTLHAPDAHIAYLAGEFNDWAKNTNGLVWSPAYAMSGPDSNGLWSATIVLPAGRHPYMFAIDGDRWIRDPNEASSDGMGHSVVIVP